MEYLNVKDPDHLYARVMKHRILYYASKYDPGRQYPIVIPDENMESEVIPESRRERFKKILTVVFSGIF